MLQSLQTIAFDEAEWGRAPQYRRSVATGTRKNPPRIGLTPAGLYANLCPAGALPPLRSNLAGNGLPGEAFLLTQFYSTQCLPSSPLSWVDMETLSFCDAIYMT